MKAQLELDEFKKSKGGCGVCFCEIYATDVDRLSIMRHLIARAKKVNANTMTNRYNLQSLELQISNGVFVSVSWNIPPTRLLPTRKEITNMVRVV